MDADQLDLKILGHVVTPGRVQETAGSASAVSPHSIPEEWTEPDDIAVCLASLTAAVIWLDEELEP